MRDRGSGSPDPTDGTYGPKTVSAIQAYFGDGTKASPHFYVDKHGQIHKLVDTQKGGATVETTQDIKTRPAFEEMTPREQAMHLYVEHGFDTAYFQGYFDSWGADSPALKYDLESMTGVLAYFEHHEGTANMLEWHWPEHEPDGDDPYGGGDIKHTHEPTDHIPPDVIASLDDAFHADRK